MLDPDYIAAWNRVNKYMMRHYRKTLCELKISDVPGYWKDKDGWTYTYFDDRRDICTGRFTSPYRSWRIIKNHDKEVIQDVG